MRAKCAGTHDRTRVCGRVSAGPVLSAAWKTTCWLRSRKNAPNTKSARLPKRWRRSCASDIRKIGEGPQGRVASCNATCPSNMRIARKHTGAQATRRSANCRSLTWCGISPRSRRRTSAWTPISIRLGSCTMKYNPKITEKIAALEGFSAAPSAAAAASARRHADAGRARRALRTGTAALRNPGHGRVHRCSRWPARTANSPA